MLAKHQNGHRKTTSLAAQLSQRAQSGTVPVGHNCQRGARRPVLRGVELSGRPRAGQNVAHALSRPPVGSVRHQHRQSQLQSAQQDQFDAVVVERSKLAVERQQSVAGAQIEFFGNRIAVVAVEKQIERSIAAEKRQELSIDRLVAAQNKKTQSNNTRR